MMGSNNLLIGNAHFEFDIFGIIGDSIYAGGAASVASTLPTPGTAWEWYQGNVYGVGVTPSVSPAADTKKSPWPKFCIDYHAATGRAAVIVNAAHSSSTISTASDNNDWQPAGDNYPVFVSEMDACLAYFGKSAPVAIFSDLGINDVQGVGGTGSQTVAQVGTNYQTVITQINTDYPSVPIVQMQIGQTALISTSARLSGIRSQIKNLVIANAGFHFGANMGAFFAGNLDVDGIHPDTAGNDYLGAMNARWVINSSFTKWTRSIIACHFGEPTTAYKNALETWMTNNQARLVRMDFCFNLKELTKLDTMTDMAFLASPVTDGGFTFTANDSIRTASSTYFDTGVLQLDCSMNGSRNDFLVNVGIKTNHTGAGVTGIALGFADTGTINGTWLGQNTTIVSWSVNKASGSGYAGQNAVQAGDYNLWRSSSTTFGLDFNGTNVSTGSTASVAFRNYLYQLGHLLENGVAGLPLDASLTRYMQMSYAFVGTKANITSEFNTFQAAY